MVETLGLQSFTQSFEVQCSQILANTNTVFKAVSYNEERKVLAYACANQVLISTTSDRPQVLYSLGGHTARVNSVAWIDANTVISVSEKVLIH